MLTTSDFLRLPYTPDLTEGGIAYAIRSLPYTYNRMGGSPFDRLRRIVAGVAVELAFRRYLSEHDIPFEVKGATPFTDRDRYDVSLGGHRCDIKSFHISHRRQISSLRTQPKVLLKAPALVPSDQHTKDGRRYDDLYIFAFLAGLVAASQSHIEKALNASQPIYLIHTMPNEWNRPKNWKPIKPLTLKSEASDIITIELSGLTKNRDFLTYTIDLPPMKKVAIEESFFSLSALHVDKFPKARVGVHSPVIGDSYIIDPFAWGNIWLYGMEVLLTGYISWEEFTQRSSKIAPGSHVFQYNKTRTKNLAVDIADLKPLQKLFDRVKEWEKNANN